MIHDRAVKIAIECIQAKMKEIHWKARRYEQHPKTWPEYKAGHKRYKSMAQAITELEQENNENKRDN